MPDTYRVNLTLRFAAELEEIFRHIEHDSPNNARRMIQRILDAVDSLDILPHPHKVLTEFDELDEEVRSMPVRRYLIRYHVNDSTRVVTILAIRHGARKPGH